VLARTTSRDKQVAVAGSRGPFAVWAVKAFHGKVWLARTPLPNVSKTTQQYVLGEFGTNSVQLRGEKEWPSGS
jgi:hypothetical protein